MNSYHQPEISLDQIEDAIEHFDAHLDDLNKGTLLPLHDPETLRKMINEAFGEEVAQVFFRDAFGKGYCIGFIACLEAIKIAEAEDLM